MKCENCGAEMIKMISMYKTLITLYVCPNVQMMIVKTVAGPAGNIYCNGKKEVKK